ncbi:MAG: hypothetical protein SP1CHLAM42_01200 [Chlamydiales bacterium]|nr:hypothetical protein [Chlamydiales bacterium]
MRELFSVSLTTVWQISSEFLIRLNSETSANHLLVRRVENDTESKIVAEDAGWELFSGSLKPGFTDQLESGRAF